MLCEIDDWNIELALPLASITKQLTNAQLRGALRARGITSSGPREDPPERVQVSLKPYELLQLADGIEKSYLDEDIDEDIVDAREYLERDEHVERIPDAMQALKAIEAFVRDHGRTCRDPAIKDLVWHATGIAI